MLINTMSDVYEKPKKKKKRKRKSMRTIALKTVITGLTR